MFSYITSRFFIRDKYIHYWQYLKSQQLLKSPVVKAMIVVILSLTTLETSDADAFLGSINRHIPTMDMA